jgi:tRNA1Val (adenine37-N6)-methyltransferase
MPSRNSFSFKRFVIEQDGCAMKVGTDGVLLGAWCRVERGHDKAMLDIGTGTGLIALQLAQRTENTAAAIEAVEIDPDACAAAARNFEESAWADRLKLHHMSVQKFASATAQKFASATAQEFASATAQKSFDHIVSNPPWFVDSLSSPDNSRNLARHTHSLSYDDLMKCCFMLLKPDGRISLIVPAGAETDRMIAAAATCDFAVSRLTEVHSTPKSGPKRTLLEFMRRNDAPRKNNYAPHISDGTPDKPVESNILVIENEGPGTFSAEYRTLTRDFYLYF